MSRPRITPRARADLLEIAEYISRDNRTAAAEVIRSIRRKCQDVIARYHEPGTKCDHLAKNLRCHSVGQYVIFYRETSTVEIVRILYGGRNIEGMFRDSDNL